VEQGFADFEGSNKVVYDMDELVRELPPQKQNNDTDR
jgi:hypothetical protein